VRAVRREVGPGFPVAVKLNSADFQKGAFSLEESCRVAAWLVEDGIDLLEISGGTYEYPRLLGAGHDAGARDEISQDKAESTKKREAYFLKYAASIRGAARVPLAVTGGFRSRTVMREALRENELDVIGIARPLCTEPSLSRHLVDGTVESGRVDERRQWLGKGLLGPGSSVATIRGLNAQAQTAWFYKQIIHLAAGAEPEFGLSSRSALQQHFRREVGLSRARKAVAT
jgi:2,4-dienoyl-CoA reductase-like NADH-dependent reductase (Old Yellow Enzyme family)